MKILHLSDIHWCARHRAWVNKAVDAAIEHSREHAPSAIVLSGDTFDAAVEAHEPAYQDAVERIVAMLDIAPVLVLQGTFSHDRPGVLAPLRHLRGAHRIHVAERIHQVALTHDGEWLPSDDWRMDWTGQAGRLVRALFSCLPSQNKAQLRVAQPDGSMMETIGELMLGWAGIHKQARASGVPAIVVSHGTVNGCTTESKQAMVSPDFEFSTGTLFSAEASAVMLGHIHLRQEWYDGGRVIAYPGSAARLIYGHDAVTGGLIWTIEPDMAQTEQLPLPARELIDLDFPGPPDMAKIAEVARDCVGAYIRLRYTIDEEQRHAVDPAQLRELLKAGGAEEVKIEPRINPVVRTRASGIHQTVSLADKVRRWCELTDTPVEPLLPRLTALESGQQPGA